MRRPLRLALVVSGLAAIIYGAASVTGAWLGTPPWWPEPISGWHRQHPSLMGEGREWIGLGLIVVGLALAVAAWSRRRPGLDEALRLRDSIPRLMVLILGSALAICGAASLTGVWLGMPPWWTTRTAPPEVQGFWAQQAEWIEFMNRLPQEASAEQREALRARSSAVEAERARLLALPSKGVFRGDGVSRWLRPGREWISGGVVAVGLGLVALGTWPRRRSGPAA